MTDNLASKTYAQRIAVILPSLEGGGAERSMLNLCRGFIAQGRQVDLVLCQAKGAYMGQIPPNEILKKIIYKQSLLFLKFLS